INGTVDHPYTLPGIQCDCCQQTWIAPSRVLPIECPTSMGRELAPRSVSFSRFCEIRDAIASARKCKAADLLPGNSLLPSSMAIPSRPQADFLWGSLGSLIVSERIKNTFVQAAFSGILFFPIMITKIGRREATLPPPIPESGEPDDIMQH